MRHSSFPAGFKGFIGLLCILVFIGCSSGLSSPTLPQNNQASLTGSSSGLAGSSIEAGYTIPFGYYEISWSGNSSDAEIQNLRTASSGTDVTDFLRQMENNPAVIDAVITDSSQFESDRTVKVDISVTHPFQSKALTVFDVMGVVLVNGSRASANNPEIRYPGADDIVLVNADGYCGIDALGGNPGIGKDFTSTIFGWRYFAEGIAPGESLYTYFGNPNSVTNRGAFLPGSKVTRTYNLRIPENSAPSDLKIRFALIAHWAPAHDLSGNRIDEPLITDFPLEANAQRAFCANLETAGSTTYYISNTDRGGEIVLDMHVWDWQTPLTSGDTVSQLSRIIVESPSGMIPGGAVIFNETAIREAVRPCCIGDYSTRLEFIVPDCLPTGQLEQLLITVESKDFSNTGNTFKSYYRSIAPISNTYIQPLGDTVNLIVYLNGAPDNLYTEVRERADAQFEEMYTLGNDAREIYRSNRTQLMSSSVRSQVAPLASRISTLREQRGLYVRALLSEALGGLQSAATQAVEAIPDTHVEFKDLYSNALMVTTRREHVRDIEALPEVREALETRFRTEPALQYSAQALKLRGTTYPNVVWDQGYRGEGIDVMAMDTGVYTIHTAFTGVPFFSSFFPTTATGCTINDAEWGSANGHGTMVCGVVCSQDATNRGTSYKIESYYNAKVCNGSYGFETVTQAFNWAAIGGSGYNDAEVINLSMIWVDLCTQDNGLDPYSSWVDNAIDLTGVVWSAACGNRGQGCAGNDINDKPQTAYNVISVAGVQTTNTGIRTDDVYYTVSKFGPVHGADNIEERLKPEIMVPTLARTPTVGGGWNNLSGTSGAAPHFTGFCAVLLDAGVVNQLDMRALAYATAQDWHYLSGASSDGPDYYTGFGYADAWNAYSHIANSYTDDLTATGGANFYKISGVQTGDRVVLVYNRHENYPLYKISNLDLQVFEESTGTQLHTTTKIYENKEWWVVPTAHNGKNVVILAKCTNLASGLSYERYAIAAGRTMTKAAPKFTIGINVPAEIHQYDVIEVSADIKNTGNLNMNSVTADITLPDGWQLVDGNDPQSLGNMAISQNKQAVWRVFVGNGDPGLIKADVSGTCYGIAATASGSLPVTVTPTVIETIPAEIKEYDVFRVSANYKNFSGSAYGGFKYTVDYDPTYLTLVSGEKTALLGNIPADESASYDWLFVAISDGATDISIMVDYTFSGVPISFITPLTSLAITHLDILNMPAQIDEYKLFYTSVAYANNFTETYENLKFTLNFNSAFLQIKFGSNPKNYGSVIPDAIGNTTWRVEALKDGITDVSVTVDFTVNGKPVAFTTPVETLDIKNIIISEYAPKLIAPFNGTVFELGTNIDFKWEPAAGTDPSSYWLDVYVDGEHYSLIPSGGIKLFKATSLHIINKFIELNAKDGVWSWHIGAEIGGNTYWSQFWTIYKETAPALIEPEGGMVIGVDRLFDWETEPGALNYVARVTGLLPAGAPYYLPLNSSKSEFTLIQPYYDELEIGVNYSWAIAATALGATMPAKDQKTLAKLSYSEIRPFTVE